MADILQFNGVVQNYVEASEVINNTPKDLDVVVIMGIDSEGKVYCTGNTGSLGDIFVLMEKTKLFIMGCIDD